MDDKFKKAISRIILAMSILSAIGLVENIIYQIILFIVNLFKYYNNKDLGLCLST
jgi:hypothetical protein